VGLALLLRQVWVWLSGQLGQDRGLRPSQWLGILPLARLLDWLGDAVRQRYKEERVIELQQPLLDLAS
jgi:hypothetical protein